MASADTHRDVAVVESPHPADPGRLTCPAARLEPRMTNVQAREPQFGPSLEANSVSISRARLITSSSS